MDVERSSRDAMLLQIESSHEFADISKFIGEITEKTGFEGPWSPDQVTKLRNLVNELVSKINAQSPKVANRKMNVLEALGFALSILLKHDSSLANMEVRFRNCRMEVEMLKQRITDMEAEKIITTNEIENELVSRIAQRLSIREPEDESELIEVLQKKMKGKEKLMKELVQKFALPSSTNASNIVNALQTQIEQCLSSLDFAPSTGITNNEMTESLRQELLKATTELLDTQEKLKEMQKQLEKKDNHIARLRSARDAMKEKLNDAAQAIRSGEQDFGELAKVESIRAELLGIRMDNEKLFRKTEKQEKKIRELEQKNEECTAQNELLKKNNKSLNEQVKHLKDGSFTQSKVVIGTPELDEIKSQLEAKETEHQKLLSLFEDVTQQFEEQTAELEEQSKARMTFITAIQKLSVVNRQLETHLEHSQTQCNESTKQIESLTQKIKELEERTQKEVVDESLLAGIAEMVEDIPETVKQEISSICEEKERSVRNRILQIIHALLPKEQNPVVEQNESEELHALKVHNQRLIAAVCSELRFIERLADSGEIQSWMFADQTVSEVRARLLSQCAKIETFLKENAIELVADVDLFDYLQIDTDPVHLSRNLRSFFATYDSPKTQEGKTLFVMLMQAVTSNEVLQKYATEARARCIHQSKEIASVKKELEMARECMKTNYQEKTREVKAQQDRIRKESETLKQTKSAILDILRSSIAMEESSNFAKTIKCIEELKTEGMPPLDTTDYVAQLEEKCAGVAKELENCQTKYDEMLASTKEELASLQKEMQEIEECSAQKLAEHEESTKKLREEIAQKDQEIASNKASLEQMTKEYTELKAKYDNTNKDFHRELDSLRKEYEAIVKALTRKLKAVEKGVEESMRTSQAEFQSNRSILKKKLSRASAELSETKAEKENAVSSLEKQITALQQELSFVKDKEACQANTIEKLQAELKDARSKAANMAVEQKMLQTKLIGKDETLRREKSQYESQLKLRLFAIDSDYQAKTEAMKNDYNTRTHDFMVRVCHLFENMIDTSQPINQDTVESLLERVRARLIALDNASLAGEQAQIELQTLRDITGASKQAKLSSHVANVMKAMKQNAADLEKLESENKAMKREVTEARALMTQEVATREWEQWARRLHSVAVGPSGLSIRSEEIRRSLEETVFAALGNRSVLKRLEFLRTEKKLLQSGLLTTKVDRGELTLRHVITAMSAVRRIQKLSGHVKSGLSFPITRETPEKDSEKLRKASTRAPLFRQFVIKADPQKKNV